ncbi:hypothetical protein [Pelagibacterium montanilacus]|uniref:hypothetical protein n=1 Tax=Pelagibacterium montanilacus TaxID=2185280 RepID=UPI000F8EC2DB|nr:hypothetical protein [Pelagibacterium montanilacus]
MRHLASLLFAMALAFVPVLSASGQSVLDITRAMDVVTERFAGRIVAAELADGRPEEGVPVVFDFRLLTETGAILRVRVDPFASIIVDVDGYGLVEARRTGRESDAQ